MEKRIYTDNFERFVKGSADDFKMIPSKRVWHSIYNDLHPSRKWPSVLMCLFLLTCVLFVGYVNTTSNNNLASTKNTTTDDTNYAGLKNENNTQPLLSSANTTPPTNTDDVKSNTVVSLSQSSPNGTNTTSSQSLQNKNEYTSKNKNATNLFIAVNNISKSNKKIKNNAAFNKLTTTKKTSILNNDGDVAAIENDNLNLSNNDIKDNTITSTEDVTTQEVLAPKLQNENKINTVEKTLAQIQTNKLTEKSAIQDLATQNKPKKKSWKGKASMEFYATPSIGYRTLNAGPKYDANPFSANNGPAPTTNLDATNPIKNNAALNLETGFNVAYASSKRIKLKAGLQLNLTNYGITGNITSHPSPTTLATINGTTQAIEYPSASSYIANNSNAIDKVHNTTYQISIPLGAYFKLLDKTKFDVFVGGSLQPTYIFGGNPNVISSDRKYYVNEGSLLRKWNMNTAAEAYINYKVGSINFLAGPQFRYQLFSTYNKNIAVTEKLYNIGFKVGVSKSF